MITRPAAAADAFAQILNERLGLRFDIHKSPILTISYLPFTGEIDLYSTVIFTSIHAVKALAEATERRDLICYAVGGSTSAFARSLGFDVREGNGTAEALTTQILQDRPRTPCLYLRGEHIAQDITNKLNSAGIETDESIIYKQTETPLQSGALALLSSGRTIILPLFSARSAQLFFRSYSVTGPLDVIALSENIAAEVPGNRARKLRICKRATGEAMVSEIVNLLNDTNQLEGRHSPK
ncbi:MAG: uroporphyrinogen-III synthase [Pseudomonadota bacterium]